MLGHGEGWFATKDEEGRIAIVLWNYKHYNNPDARLAWDKDTVDDLFSGGSSLDVELELHGLEEGSYRVSTSKIDGINSSAFHAWKFIGAPDWLTRDQVSYLKKVQRTSERTEIMDYLTKLALHPTNQN